MNKNTNMSAYLGCKKLGTLRTLSSVLGLPHIFNLISRLGARRLPRFVGVTCRVFGHKMLVKTGLVEKPLRT